KGCAANILFCKPYYDPQLDRENGFTQTPLIGQRSMRTDMTPRLMPNSLHQVGKLQLTTAEIFYYLPDHPSILQSFLWQHYDAAPRFPRLTRFLEFWRTSVEATLA